MTFLRKLIIILRPQDRSSLSQNTRCKEGERVDSEGYRSRLLQNRKRAKHQKRKISKLCNFRWCCIASKDDRQRERKHASKSKISIHHSNILMDFLLGPN